MLIRTMLERFGTAPMGRRRRNPWPDPVRVLYRVIRGPAPRLRDFRSDAKKG
jgi:hypothetical protein